MLKILLQCLYANKNLFKTNWKNNKLNVEIYYHLDFFRPE